METAMIFFFNDTATTEIYTLSLHDALPIWMAVRGGRDRWKQCERVRKRCIQPHHRRDRKSTRLNSSHLVISYAVFCLKKKKCRDPQEAHEGQRELEQPQEKEQCSQNCRPP